jgi:uncharacterized membrane protein YgdD (TMEM256/DUF423 family)
MYKLKIISIFGALAVILGAFGSHGLKPKLNPDSYDSYQTAVLYHFIHVLAMGLVYLMVMSTSNTKVLNLAFNLFAVGIVLFSGSIYILSTMEITGFGYSNILGPITPIGGLLYMAGWILLFFQTNNK